MIKVSMCKENFIDYVHMDMEYRFSNEELEAIYDYYDDTDESVTVGRIAKAWHSYSSDWTSLPGDWNKFTGEGPNKFETITEYVDELRRRTIVIDIETNDHTYHLVNIGFLKKAKEVGVNG